MSPGKDRAAVYPPVVPMCRVDESGEFEMVVIAG